jgi:hypothetical protein
MAEAARGKYCVFCGDDDLLLPSGLDACRTFLENNRDYKTVQGDSCLFVMRSADGVAGRFDYAQHYWKSSSLEEGSSLKRLQAFSNNYWVPQFSLHRTEDFVRVQKLVSRFSDNHFFELISNALFIASGKSKFLPTPYLLRQAHDRRIHHFSLYDWQAQSVFKESYDQFIDLLAQVLEDETPADIGEARQAAAEFFKTYLSIAQSRPLKPPRKVLETQRVLAWFKRLLGRYLGTYSEHHMLRSLTHYLSPNSPLETRALLELRTFVKILHGARGQC